MSRAVQPSFQENHQSSAATDRTKKSRKANVSHRCTDRSTFGSLSGFTDGTCTPRVPRTNATAPYASRTANAKGVSAATGPSSAADRNRLTTPCLRMKSMNAVADPSIRRIVMASGENTPNALHIGSEHPNITAAGTTAKQNASLCVRASTMRRRRNSGMRRIRTVATR